MADSNSEAQELLPPCSLFPLSIWPTAPTAVPSFPAGVLCNKMLFPLLVLPFLLLPGWGVMSRPIGTDICWTLSTPLGQAGFWLVVQKFMGFFFLWSRWACGPSNPSTSFLFLGDTVYSLLLLGSRSESHWWVCTAAELHLYIYFYIFPWKHAWCTANSCAFDTKAFVNWVVKLLPWCCVLESVGLIIHRRWLSSEDLTCSQIILF